MIKDIKNILLVVLFIIIAILLFKTGCNKPSTDLSPKTDSVTTHDTVWAKDTIIAFKSIYKPIHDTVYQIDTFKHDIDPLDLFFVREYNDTLNDTNQTIYTHIRTLGMIDKLDIKYKLKIPIKINTTTAVTHTNIVTKIPRFSIYTGLEAGGNTSTFNLSPFINLNIKNNSVSYRYGVLDKTHNVGVGIKLYNSKK